MDYRPGDIIAFRGRNWFSRQILKHSGNTVSHVGMIVGTEPTLITEALWRVRTHALAEALDGCDRAWLISDYSLPQNVRDKIVLRASLLSADGYGIAGILLQAIDVACNTTWFTDHLGGHLARHPICSYLVASAYAMYGLTFGKKMAESVTPADIFTFAKEHPEIYTVTEILADPQ